MHDYNDIINELDLLQTYPGNLKLLRMKGKGSFFVGARDFTIVNHVKYDSTTGVIETVSGSVEDPKCPPDKKFVRAYMKIMGTRFTPTNDGKTYMITISMADPKGSVPNMFKGSAGKQQSTRANLINKNFKKRFGIK